MPRKARIDAPGALNHIIVRGINRRKIFFDDADRDDFLDRLGNILSDSKTPCFAWAFMTNHLQRVIDLRKATKSGTGSKRAMLLGDTRTRDERGFDIEKAEHRFLDSERIRDERTANRRGTPMETYGTG